MRSSCVSATGSAETLSVRVERSGLPPSRCETRSAMLGLAMMLEYVRAATCAAWTVSKVCVLEGWEISSDAEASYSLGSVAEYSAVTTANTRIVPSSVQRRRQSTPRNGSSLTGGPYPAPGTRPLSGGPRRSRAGARRTLPRGRRAGPPAGG